MLQIRFWLRREMLPVTVMVGTLMAFRSWEVLFGALATHALEPLPDYDDSRRLVLYWHFNGAVDSRARIRGADSGAGNCGHPVGTDWRTPVARDRRHRDDVMAALQVSPEIKTARCWRTRPSVCTPNAFLFHRQRKYEPDEDVRSRLALVYSEAEEVRYGHMDTLHAYRVAYVCYFTIVVQIQHRGIRLAGEHTGTGTC